MSLRDELAACRAELRELQQFRRLVTHRLLGDIVQFGTGRGRPVRLFLLCSGDLTAGNYSGHPHLIADPTARTDAEGVLIPPIVVAVDPADGTVSGGRWRVDQVATESPDGIITSFTLPTTPAPGTVMVFDDGTYQGAPTSISGQVVTLAYAPDTGVTLRFCYLEAS